MKYSKFSKLFIIAFLIPGALLSVLVPNAAALDSVICESDDDRFRRCRVRTFSDLRNADVRVASKFSKSGCNEGRSWGVERDAIWVDKGCRARFEIDYDGYRPSSSWNHSYDWDNSGRYHGHDSYDRYDRNSPFDDYRSDKAHRELEYERERLERERLRLEEEKARNVRDQVERERQRIEQERSRSQTCPPGARPGRCADWERRSGCKDWRISSGLGCRSN